MAVSNQVNDTTTLKGIIDNNGEVDLALTTKVRNDLSLTFTSGGNISGFFSKGNLNVGYSGINLKFTV